MTRSLILLTFVCACAPLVAGQAQSGSARAVAWSRYTYPGEEFSVELPEMPLVFHTSRIVREMPYESEKTRVFGVYAGGVIYIIVSSDKPRSFELDEQLMGYLGGGLTPSGDVKAGGTTGREYDITTYFKGRARFFRMKGHAYLVEAFADAGGREADIGRFLNSFTLGGSPAGEMVADDPPVTAFASLKETPTPATQGIGPGTGGGNSGGLSRPGVGEETLKLARRAGTGVEAAGPYRSVEVEKRAIIVYKPEPGFTEEARRHYVTGVVRLRAVLSSSGKVTNISVVKGLPDGLSERAAIAARHILFFPAVKGGREVSQYVVLEYNFNIY
ncbi:MAG TPA: energy transducer TonB [Pyrinomonadaceae bacterium]